MALYSVIVTFEVEANEDLLETLELDEDESAASVAEAIREYLNDDTGNLSEVLENVSEVNFQVTPKA